MGRIKKAFKNLSIKKTFMLYMLIFLLAATLLSSITINISSNISNNISLLYSDSNSKMVFENSEDQVIISSIHADIAYTAEDKTVIDACDFIGTWSIPVFFGLCIVISSLLFYRNKLKKPIEILNTASEKIADNDLGFNIFYDSRDEMGQLCGSFEKMRASLEENNHQMWRSIEERKRLNSAFSHDLRTPLTVLRGYSDFLKNYLPEGKVSEEKLISTVSTMSEHITRLESYVQTMSEIQRLEDVNISAREVNAADFIDYLKSICEILSQREKLNIRLINDIYEREINIDSQIVIRVFENLISNAARYAQNKIDITCKLMNSMLQITVSDDGNGFSAEDKMLATKPYYKNKINSSELHFGLGLNICKILCEKHGGGINLENNSSGGAVVTVSFSCTLKIMVKVDKK